MSKAYIYNKVLPLAFFPIFITACGSGEFVGSNGSDDTQVGTPVTFSCAEQNQEVTRAAESGPLSDFVNDFIVYGGKQVSSSFQPVFKNYTVWHSTASSSTNTNTWEYVGEYAGKVNSEQDQDIRYWDFSAEKYTFWAIAKAANLNSGFTVSDDGTVSSNAITQTIDSVADDAKCLYYTNPTYVEHEDFGKPVVLPFLRFRTKIRIGFYEDLKCNEEGNHRYVVKNLRFYPASADDGSFASTAGSNVYLSGTFATEEKLTMSYDATKTNIATEVTDSTCSLDMGTLSYTGDYLPTTTVWAKQDGAESEFVSVMPNINAGAFYLLCSYEVIDTQGTDENTQYMSRINAYIPAIYTQWEPNHSYSYVFRITDMSDITLTDVQVSDWAQGSTTTERWHNW